MTTKQLRATAISVENGGNVSRAMIEAGYSPATAKNPSKLTNSKAYRSIYDPILKKNKVTIDKYIKNIGEAMDASKVTVIGKGDDAFAEVTPDHMTRLAGNKQAERFLFKDSNSNDPASIQGLTEAINNNVDEVELTQLVFRKQGTSEPVEQEKGTSHNIES